MERLQKIQELQNLRAELLRDEYKPGRNIVKVCCGLPCSALGAHKVVEALEEESSNSGLQVSVVKTGCQGLCQKGPLVQIEPHGFFYQKVRADKAKELISTTFSAGEPVREFVYRDSFLEETHDLTGDVPFYKKQMKIALRNMGAIDPFDIKHYIAVGGYGAVEKMFSSMDPDAVLEEVKKANLRGRGGAGFPAGVKWAHSKKSPSKIRLVIANGDEGDPGAFMDRSVMEGDPHSLLEGMLICAYAIDARYGFIYVRHEYPLAIKTLKAAIKQAEELGLLGKNILGTGFDFTVQIRAGAGAFVCGESTSLVASLEGERGFPRPRPPRLSENGGGAWGYPSNLNNIETYACVPPIVEKGADWFLDIGTEGSPGTKVFSLAGKVRNTGLVEVPMGITLREIVFDIGGGIIGNKKLKAVQTGGPSGGCIPEQFLDSPVDFDSLRKVGSIMGSGGMVVMDEDNCMVDVAKFFLSFTQAESCGKCPPCRIGTYQMLRILENITSGRGEEGDIEKLESLGRMVQAGSLCGLGQSAPNPVLTTIRYFRHEYEEHIRDKYCRAKVCGLGTFVIDQKECILCGLCKEACAFDAINEGTKSFSIDRDYCTRCKACVSVCPVQAVKIVKPKYVRLEEELKITAGRMEVIEMKSKMTLKDILASRPYEIITISNKSTVSDAVELMSRKNVSGLFVVDRDGRLIGIFTERDIVRCVFNGIPDNRPLDELTVRDITVFDPSIAVSSAISTASRKKIRHLPVVEDGAIVGMVTFRDLISYMLPEITFMAETVQ
ncbi:MAG TPA: NADH-ubiquinone oxidoreductase-F iron-sulfur binding region domain-containing protein [Thermodesulfovibrionales bacterium]|nr:NADH-ubiquinone oxidoreductase-F iron-sulfur binding region domain-containing protein [Thermodesulfovibrionales bacterium]